MMSGAHATIGDAQLLAGFREDGFVSIPGFLDRAELDDLRTELDRVVRDVVPRMPSADVYHENLEDPTSLKQLQRLQVHDERLGAYLLTGPFAQLAATLLEDVPAPQNLQFFNKSPGANQPTPAHQDGAYFPIHPMNAVTLWLALEDVAAEQGCLRYLQGSHRGGLRPHRRGGTLGFSREVCLAESGDLERERAFPCAAGHLIAHHPLTIHRAGGNASPNRSRRALGFIYYGAACEIDEQARSGYQSQLDEELRAAGRLR